MKESYVLLQEPWIPAVSLNGQTSFWGIRPLLEQAHTLRAISDVSPLIEYGLYRLLCVFLMDALQPKEDFDLEMLLDQGQFDMDPIDAYLTLCRQEGVTFDLFDEKRPFLQTPFCIEWDKTPKPASILDHTIPNGNNHTHFDHRHNEQIAFSYAQAARLLPAALIFCTAGVQGYPSSINGAPPYFTLIQGKNLFETLVLSLLSVDDIFDFDQPPVVWRSTMPVEPKKIVIKTSWLYGMLFPVRRILLCPNPDSKTVSQVYLSQGLNYQLIENWTDPHVTYRVNKKGRFPWRPNQEKAPWRNLNDLLNLDRAPQTVRRYAKSSFQKYMELRLYGVQTNQASYICTTCHDMKIPVQIIGDNSKIKVIKKAIESSEAFAAALAKVLQSPEIPPQAVSQAVQIFYDSCEQRLWKLCDALALPETEASLYAFYETWIAEIQSEVWAVLDQTVQSLQLRGRSLLELTKAQGLLFHTLKKLK